MKKIEEQLRVEDTWTEQIVEFRRNTIGMIQANDGSVTKTEKMVDFWQKFKINLKTQ